MQEPNGLDLSEYMRLMSEDIRELKRDLLSMDGAIRNLAKSIDTNTNTVNTANLTIATSLDKLCAEIKLTREVTNGKIDLKLATLLIIIIAAAFAAAFGFEMLSDAIRASKVVL